MKTMSTARKVLAIAFASATLAGTFLAAATPANAGVWRCSWTSNGRVCNYSPY